MQTVKDWLSATKIDFSTYFSESINIHHIFPVAWCVKNGISKDDYNCIINKTPLSGHTNRIVGDAEYEKLKNPWRPSAMWNPLSGTSRPGTLSAVINA